MKNLRTSLVLLSILALAVVAAASGALQSSAGKGSADQGSQSPMAGMNMSMHAASSTAASSSKAVQLRITLDQLLGEHALLAIQATQRGYAGGADFKAIAAQLDANSVALSKAIASVYGPAAGKQFLDGKNLWRAHIKYFVDYTVALAKHDSAGQKKAVANLMTYIQVQAAFFAKATGLPKAALVNDLTAHVLQLKGQLDAYAKGDYAQSYALTDGAYKHMFMTGDLLSAAIAKQKHLGSTTGKAADLEVTLDQLLGEHALARNVGDAGRRQRWEELPGTRQAARQELGCDLSGDRLALRCRRRQAVPERRQPLARTHQRLRRVHRRDGEGRQRRPEEGRREPHDVHPGAGRVLREGDRPAEGGSRQRPDRARPAAQGRARLRITRSSTTRRSSSSTVRTSTCS